MLMASRVLSPIRLRRRRRGGRQNIPPVTADIPVTNSEDSYPEDPVDDTTPNTEPQPLEGDDSAITEFDFEESLFCEGARLCGEERWFGVKYFLSAEV